MGLFKNTEEHKDAQLVSDLDALVSDTIAFQFQGKSHYLKPLKTLEFLRYIKAMKIVNQVMAEPEASAKDVIEAGHQLISSVCETITYEDVTQMTHAQLNAVIRLIVEAASGKAFAEAAESKKKIVKIREMNQKEA